jgi:hypothetical protein
MQHVDGNALAGRLAEIFPFDVTVAVGRCRGCGATEMIGDTMVYPAAPGFIVRCPSCESVLATLVDSGTRVWLSLSGVRELHVAH